MFGDYDLLVWVLVGVGSLLVVTRLIIMPLVVTVNKVNKKAAVVKEQESDQLNEKNMANLAGGAAAGYIDNLLNNVEQGYMQAKAIYDKQLQECKAQNLSAADTEKILAPLRGKMNQANFLLQNREGLAQMNKVMTAPLVGRLAKKIIGGLM